MFPKRNRRAFCLFVFLFHKNDVLAKTVFSFFLEALWSPKNQTNYQANNKAIVKIA